MSSESAPAALPPPDGIERLQGLTNREFLTRYAKAGCVGLASGTTLIDKAICMAERHVHGGRRWGLWTHAFIFEGERADGHIWLLESDMMFTSSHVLLGAQENRITRFDDVESYANLAVLDFGLTPAQSSAVIGAGLDLVAARTQYSVRELLGAWLALKRQEQKEHANRLGRDHSYFCSAFVNHAFRHAGIDLLPGVDEKSGTPEEIFHSPLPHRTYVLVRRKVTSSAVDAVRRVRHTIRKTLR